MATYVVADLHGQYGVFEKGLEKIGFNQDDMLYVIGDAVDRGRDGIKLLSCIKEQDNMDLLIGNHEFMMLNSIEPERKFACTGPDSDLWLFYNGGTATYEGFKGLSTEEKESIISWLKGRYVIKTLSVSGREYCLTHSYYYPEHENKRYSEMTYRDVWDTVWISIYRWDPDTRGENIYKDYDYTFITGHVPVQNAEDNPFSWEEELHMYVNGNLIDIDGGCARGYRKGLENGAIFLRLDDMEEFTVPLRSP